LFYFTIIRQNSYSIYLYEILIGVAASFVSGADLSILYDSIDDNDRAANTKAISLLQINRLIGETVSALIAGVLVLWGFSWRIYGKFSFESILKIHFFVFGPLVGFIIDRYGMDTGPYTLAAVYFCLIFILMIPMLKYIPSKYQENL
jgi:MFS family permease